MSNIGIFGGTFNPPHKGHVNLAKHAIDKLCLERLYIIPSNIPPHKTILNDVRGKDRLKMAKLAFSDIPNSAILDIELKRGGVSYTIDTVIELKKGLSEEDRIYLLMGNDMLEIIEKWHRFEELFKLCRIAVFKRNEKAETGKIIEFLSKKYNAEIIEVDCPVIDISSTDIRDMDINSMKKVLPTKVLDYILKHHLYEHSQIEYFKKILSENLSEYRYEHSLSVSREAVKLAEIYGGEPYAMAGDVYSNPDFAGRCGWSLYTGAAAWYYKAVLEYLLGYDERADGFSITPKLSARFPGFTLQVQRHGTQYTIRAQLGDRTEYRLDGEPVADKFFPFDKKRHNLEITVENKQSG